jgi:hypothetical protein
MRSPSAWFASTVVAVAEIADHPGSTSIVASRDTATCEAYEIHNLLIKPNVFGFLSRT